MRNFTHKWIQFKAFLVALLIALFPVVVSGETGAAEEPGTILTIWPLIDYRESPAERYFNLSLLGPLVKFQQRKDDHVVAIRPFFYHTSNDRDKTAATEYLYPVASSETSPDMSTVQVIKLFQKNEYRKDEPGRGESATMLFPFYISGTSERYGPYTSVFPLYGDIYERFWRDEYHYVLFPLYGRTVKKGTTTTNVLYPFFSLTQGHNEHGFQFWPLYGESAKEGVYERRFVLWPFYLQERSGLDTDNPTSKRYVLPFYAATSSPKTSARYYFWPFFGHKTEQDGNQEEWDYLWPFLWTVRGEKRNVTSVLPFYLNDERKDSRKSWFMWPLFKQEEINSAEFRQERSRILYFFFSDSLETWPKDGAQKRRTTLWPLFLYNRDPRGVKSLSLPAPVEPVLDRDGIDRNWAPLWRLYQQKWSDNGELAVSLFWNLYWHERRGDDLAYELFPLIDYRSEQNKSDIRFLKGLIRYRNNAGGKSLGFFWLPLAFGWGTPERGPEAGGRMDTGSAQ